MHTLILKSKSKSNIKLLTDLAKKIGVDSKILSESEIEETALSYAIKKGRTKEYIDTEKICCQVKKWL